MDTIEENKWKELVALSKKGSAEEFNSSVQKMKEMKSKGWKPVRRPFGTFK